jgi:hypothetical protein
MKTISHGLEAENKELKKRDADLSIARQEMKLKQAQSKVNILILEVMHRLIAKISSDMKWDLVLEIISLDLLKLPGVVAFEIGTRAGKFIQFEGYSEHSKNFTSAQRPDNPDTCLAAYCIYHAKSFVFNNLAEQSKKLLIKRDKKLEEYKSAISVPFYLNNKNAIIFIYSDTEDLFDDYALKAMEIFAAYLEQIIKA